MYMMKGALALFMSLAIGYVLCILADKQKKGLLQIIGYTLGAAILALSLLYSVLDSCNMMCGKSDMGRGHKGVERNAGVFMKGQMK